MFGYYHTIHRLKADYEKMPFPDCSAAEKKPEPNNAWGLHRVFRFAACGVLTVAVVTAAIVLPPALRSPTPLSAWKGSTAKVSDTTEVTKTNHDFELIAYAAENQQASSGQTNSAAQASGSITLKNNLVMVLPKGGFRFKEGGFVSYSFTCKGANLKTTRYTVQTGSLLYFSKNRLRRYQQALLDTSICAISVPTSTVGKDPSTWFSHEWYHGGFQEYKDKYFGGKTVDLDQYNLHFFSDWRTQGNTLILIQQIRSAGNLPQILSEGVYLSATTIDVPPTDTKSEISWLPYEAKTTIKESGTVPNPIEQAASAAEEKAHKTGVLDYSSVPGDTITVTATFTDGQTVTKHIDLSFKNDGTLCAKLTD